MVKVSDPLIDWNYEVITFTINFMGLCMVKKITLEAMDFSRHPEAIQMDGKNLFALRYKSKQSDLYAAYSSIKRCLDHCLINISYINEFRGKTGEPYVQENIATHFVSLIVNYGRCFVSGRVKLEETLISNGHKTVHRKLMGLRHAYVAHSGGAYETSVNLVALYPNSKRKKLIHIEPPRLVAMNTTNPEFLREVQGVILVIYEFVENKLKLHFEKIHEEIVGLGEDALYAGFASYALEDFEYEPKFRPGTYVFHMEVAPNGAFQLKGTKKQESREESAAD
jgi:hypothetical protein